MGFSRIATEHKNKNSDFRFFVARTIKDYKRSSTEQIPMLFYIDNIISAWASSEIGFLFQGVFVQIFNYFERILSKASASISQAQGEGH